MTEQQHAWINSQITPQPHLQAQHSAKSRVILKNDDIYFFSKSGNPQSVETLFDIKLQKTSVYNITSWTIDTKRAKASC